MKKTDSLRINIFIACVMLAFGLVSYRLFVLSYVRHSHYALTAQAQTEHINNVLARGNIYITDKDGNEVLAATNKKFPLAYVVPVSITPDNQQKAIDSLVQILALPADQVTTIVRSNADYARAFQPRLTNEQVDKIKNLGIKGVGVNYEMDRSYPNDQLASDVLGFLGYDGNNRVGQYGVESFFDADLAGKKSATTAKTPSKPLLSRITSIFNKEPKTTPEVTFDKPNDVVLTIDKNIQVFVEQTLEDAIKKWSAVGGSVIVEEPTTGRILAMADRPTFNPNAYGTASPELFLNSSVQGQFEPGSSFKPVTMSAGLDLGKVTPDTKFTDPGFEDIAGYKIKNFSDKVFGEVTMSEVLEKSINTGVMFVEKKIGDDNFLNYVLNMGFGQQTGIDLPGEVSGDISNLYSGRKINYLTASFGQGIAVTPLQLINAYAAIANGGKLMKPYVVEKIVTGTGQEKVTKPEVIGIPISEKTAVKLQGMLVSVVDKGFDKARISGYDIAGKTGTAQIPDSHGGYIENQYIHDFLGFAPAYNARFVIMIKLDKPQGITFASDSLSPTFRTIAAFLLNYYNIAPTRQ